MLTLYIIRDKEGKFFPKRFSSWSDSLDKAKIYATIGSARARITEYARNGTILDLIELKVTELTVLDESERVKKSLQKIENRKLQYEKRQAKYRLKIAQNNHEETKRKLEEMERLCKQNISI